MTDERLEQLLRQALIPEIGESDIVIHKRQKRRKSKWYILIAASIAAACVIAGIHADFVERLLKRHADVENSAGTIGEHPIFSVCVYASELRPGGAVYLDNREESFWALGMETEKEQLSYSICFPVTCRGEGIQQIVYSINKGAFQMIGENPKETCKELIPYDGQSMNPPLLANRVLPQETISYSTSYTIDYERQSDELSINVCGLTTKDDGIKELFFSDTPVPAVEKAKQLSAILYGTEITVCVMFEDGTDETKTITARADVRTVTGAETGKGQTASQEVVIAYEMRQDQR